MAKMYLLVTIRASYSIEEYTTGFYISFTTIIYQIHEENQLCRIALSHTTNSHKLHTFSVETNNGGHNSGIYNVRRAVFQNFFSLQFP